MFPGKSGVVSEHQQQVDLVLVEGTRLSTMHQQYYTSRMATHDRNRQYRAESFLIGER